MTPLENPLVHVGYPKCASTFLQRTLLPGSDEIHIDPSWWHLAIDRFMLTSDADFDARAVAAEFSVANGDEGRVPAVSHEALACGLAARFDLMAATADRIEQTFPDARVLIVIREQRSMVLSAWRQLVRRGESITLDQAIRPSGSIGHYPRLRLDRLRFDHLHQLYVDRFGADRVEVVPMELLSRDAPAFSQQVLEFATGGPVAAAERASTRDNAGYQGATLAVRRRLNRIGGENVSGPGGSGRVYKAVQRVSEGVEAVLPAAAHTRFETAYRATVEDVVGDMFTESNRVLAERTGLDLASFGYPV